MKVSTVLEDSRFLSRCAEIRSRGGVLVLLVAKDPVFPSNDTPKSKYEKLENRISKSSLLFFF